MSTLGDDFSAAERSSEGDSALPPINGNSSAAENSEKQARLPKSIEHMDKINRIRDLPILNRAVNGEGCEKEVIR